MHDILAARVWELVGEPARRLTVARVEVVAEQCVRAIVAFTEALERELGKARGFAVAQEAFLRRFERRASEVTTPAESPAGPKDNSLQAFAALVDEVCHGTHDFCRIDDTPDRVAYRFTRCVWSTHFRHLGRPDIGHWFCDGDDKWARGFNPQIGFQRTQVLMDGDACCDHVFFLERSETA
jgi:L-2-amino-thiazoline-4-carboxylic acid hydrolase